MLWSFITAMSFGIPERICQIIDQITFQRITHEVYQMKNGFYYDVNNNDMPTIAFLVIFGVIFILSFFLMCWISKRLTEKHSLRWIIFFSILFRLILLPGELIHENDIYRYIWDGKTTLHKVNPYKYAPIEVAFYDDIYWNAYDDDYDDTVIEGKAFSDADLLNLEILHELRDQSPVFYKRIGHWEVPTIYPPITQILLTIPVMVNRYSLILMKTFFVLFDVGSLFLIIALLKHFKKDSSMSIIYGWSPLVLFEIANGGHYDSIPIFLTMLSLLLFFKSRQWGGTYILALATLSKFFSGVLLPILIKPFKKRYLLMFSAIICVFYAPFIFWDQTGLKGVFKGLITYNQQWSYNAGIFAIIKITLEKLSLGLTESMMPAKVVAGCMYLVIWAILVLKKDKNEFDVLHKCFLAIALLFILNPVADPWYFCWVIPFLCFFPYRSWYLLSGLLMLSYLNFHSDIGIVDMRYLDFPLIGWLIYVPFYLTLASECLRKPTFITDKI